MDRLFARFRDDYFVYQSENELNPIICYVKHIVSDNSNQIFVILLPLSCINVSSCSASVETNHQV